MNITKQKSQNDEKSKKETEEITVEKLNEGLRALAIIAYFEKEVGGKIPHPLRIFKCRRWMREFEAFQKGFELGQKYMCRIIEKEREEEEENG